MTHEKSDMEKEGVGKRVLIFGHKCYRCGHAWRPYDLENPPIVCPKCKSPYWHRPRIKFFKNGEKSTQKTGKN